MAAEHHPHQVFNESFTERLQRGILRCVVVGWDSAHRTARSRFDYWAFHDVIAHMRRAYVEHNLRAFAKRHRLTAGTKGRLNYALNSYHTELIAGRTVLTASAVDGPDQMVRGAKFRNTLARDPQDSWLDTPSAPAPDDPLCGVVLYGPLPDKSNCGLPGFVCIRFPDQNWSCYIGEPVDLLAKFPAAYKDVVLRLRRESGVDMA